LFKVRVQVTIEPNREIPNGVYINQTFMFWDNQWQGVIRQTKDFIEELEEFEK